MHTYLVVFIVFKVFIFGCLVVAVVGAQLQVGEHRRSALAQGSTHLTCVRSPAFKSRQGCVTLDTRH